MYFAVSIDWCALWTRFDLVFIHSSVFSHSRALRRNVCVCAIRLQCVQLRFLPDGGGVKGFLDSLYMFVLQEK